MYCACFVVAYTISLKEADLVVGPRTGVAYFLAKQEVAAWHLPCSTVIPMYHPHDLLAKLRRSTLVGINEEDPLGCRSVQREIALASKILEPICYHMVGYTSGDIGSGRIGLVIEHEKCLGAQAVYGGAHTGETWLKVVGLVPCQGDNS